MPPEACFASSAAAAPAARDDLPNLLRALQAQPHPTGPGSPGAAADGGVDSPAGHTPNGSAFTVEMAARMAMIKEHMINCNAEVP